MNNRSSVSVQDSTMESLLCVSGSSIIKSGFLVSHSTDKPVMFVNAGGCELLRVRDSTIEVEADRFHQGGDVLRTDEQISCGGDLPSIYQSARFGDFCYQFMDLPPGEYSVDLHFSEIVNTNGPRGMRVFNVFIQGEKASEFPSLYNLSALSELDIYSVVGANHPLQVINIGVSAGNDGLISINFEGVVGSPIVSGICIKEASPYVHSSNVTEKNPLCENCSVPVRLTAAENKAMRMNFTATYEKQIKELKTQCQLKQDECYEAWMSLTAANQELEKVRAELDVKFFQNFSLGQAVEKQTEKMREISSQYEYDRRQWATAIAELERKMKIIKSEHAQLSQEAHQCANSIPGLHHMVTAVQSIVVQYDDLKKKFNEEQERRKKLYNELLEAKGNIRVFCRCRPLSIKEVSLKSQTIVDFAAAKDGDLGVLMNGTNKKVYKFDRVYTPKDDQCDVFEDASPVATSVLDGYNVCIFAYGQTGTGKTFTMEGTEQNRGVNYRTLELLFRIAEEKKDTMSYDIYVSVLEVYNEQIRDLLATSPPAKRLEIKQVSEGAYHVPGVVEAKVENIDEVWNILRSGSNARTVGSNNVNEYSSRSHCMICTLVRAKNLITEECTRSKLWLVDLAGSERLAKTEVQGERLKEAQSINKSLFAFGDVISALATKSSHIPYRNSKLTHLLQDSLGGDSKTLMFVQISPSEHDLGETLRSLNFATRVRGLESSPAKKQPDMTEIQKLKVMADKLRQELKCKDDTIGKLEDSVQSLEGKTNSKDQFCKSQQERIVELENQVAAKVELCGQLETQLSQISDRMERKEEACNSYQQKIRELEDIMRKKSRQSELHSEMLLQKVKMLEEKLQQEERRADDQVHILGSRTVQAPRAETIVPLNRRSLNPSNGMLNTEDKSILLKGTDSLRELRRKRDLQIRGPENNSLFLGKKVVSAESESSSSKSRQLDPSRALARITRSGMQQQQAGGSAPIAFPNRFKDNSNTVRGKIWLR
ncbi:Kinesin-like protein KIN-14R [Linum perenne]